MACSKVRREKLETELFWLQLVLLNAWVFGNEYLDCALSHCSSL